jgi:hypothetical protein
METMYLKRLQKINNSTLGENSANLVTLPTTYNPAWVCDRVQKRMEPKLACHMNPNVLVRLDVRNDFCSNERLFYSTLKRKKF